ncbi:diguanylate cyclase (GGDEF) domain-containing protein [Desulfotomaculum arcticum]|uniref:Diguanylate cyclase (GGDEF) domain-containing protein n=1 Tax=Desulfotruncus arcticus DSM 17038 TaxID=1121424 RepID=A0A1I2U0D7_9FIRM|nr:sensor domain-containing diguanylate cyclase [Desulfotruncus arcticus]SFG69097.1 diguanylate cyclase (GGDEF) domain-containing protein [Desulfotomaculum arcticum] [Desulfotruncus arcticus DSM 17038]
MSGKHSIDERINLLEKINEKLTNLNWITAQIAGEQNLDTIYNSIVNGFEQITGIPKCGLFKLEDHNYKTLIVKNKDINNVPVLCDSVVRAFNTALKDRVLLVKDMHTEGFCPEGCYDCVTTDLQVCTLYESNGNPYGVLCAYGKSDIPDEDTLLMIMELYAMQIGLTLENVILNSKLVSLSITDALTGLYNHRYFYERIERELYNIRGTIQKLTLLMLDVDDFKSYNDTFGHPEGDIVLKNISLLVKSVVGDKGVCCRYGGEEMAVIMPGAMIDEGVETGNKICRAIENCDNFKRKVTVSIGVATVGSYAVLGDLVRSADNALYKAKSEGKNMVVAGVC